MMRNCRSTEGPGQIGRCHSFLFGKNRNIDLLVSVGKTYSCTIMYANYADIFRNAHFCTIIDKISTNLN